MLLGLALAGAAVRAAADEPALPPEVTLDNVTEPAANSPDEPLAGQFSLAKAVFFLDSAAVHWQKQRDCMTCHTNYAFLMARPYVGWRSAAHATVRAYAERLVSERWEAKGPRWDAEVVATAAALAFNDSKTSGKLHPLTRQALDRMWTVQQEDGGFRWLKCNWPPMESDDHYGATLAAIAAGIAPEDYRQTPAAETGLEKIRGYLTANPPPMLHHKAMVLWASTLVDGLMSPQQKKECIDELVRLQRPDGGWSSATLGDWKRHDSSPQDTQTSDGYGTGFVLYVLRQAGAPADDPALAQGVTWLKTHQRESGRWFSRSLYKDSKHFLSHAGTAFAVMALAECGAAK
jgi:squalene-hopene/tetraprenyl-beta-curcumene cyclase